jgi:hypothetical protein
MIDVTPRELVNPVEDELYHYQQEDRDRLTALIGPGCELLNDGEVDRLLGIGRRAGQIFASSHGTTQSAPFGAVSGEAWGPAACHASGRHVGTGKPHNNNEVA